MSSELVSNSTVSASTQTGNINTKIVVNSDANAAEAVAPAETVRAPRKPKLAAKHAAFVQFLFWLSKADSVPSSLRSLALSSDIDSQRAFVDDFLSQQSELAKEMRTIVTLEAKAAKAAAKAAATSDSGTKANASRGRKKKTPVAEPVSDIISELVSIANGGAAVDDVPPPSSEHVVADTATSNQKPVKPKRAPRNKTPPLDSASATDNKKKRAPRNKIAPPLDSAMPILQPQRGGSEGAEKGGGEEGEGTPDDTQDVHVELVLIDGKSFLRDDSGTLYDPVSHSPI